MAGVRALQWLNLTRHGESTGNLAYQAVLGTDAEEAGITERDADIPLSDTGRAQAATLGRWLAALPEDERPTHVIASPYLRTVDTAEIALAQTSYAAPRAPGGLRLRVDERLRDREQGALQGLTALGVRRRFPAEAARLDQLGKFYYRPPGGESWADLALRLRSFYRDLEADAAGGRVLVVTHDAIIVMTRYLVEELTEAEIMRIEKEPVANASVTRWRGDGSGLQAVCYNDCAHLAGLGAPPPAGPAEPRSTARH
ncbi:histidine phosphatase family protein [Actinomadura sp. NAK00032]|uniref:histidine phosphatase family protein n=1 Tax=Actinomadura sp. NAK00032 TaxID=2742128 RepID=UPI0015906FE5|nr:histidine phosphatase family protein [Actinomadura sp. NAK00032]QKW37265.1 histidine phosphatase family protein [Actinomadura sp. NAK00032]